MNHTLSIVDDERDMAQMLRRYFEWNGYAVIVAENGVQARYITFSEPAQGGSVTCSGDGAGEQVEVSFNYGDYSAEDWSLYQTCRLILRSAPAVIYSLCVLAAALAAVGALVLPSFLYGSMGLESFRFLSVSPLLDGMALLLPACGGLSGFLPAFAALGLLSGGAYADMKRKTRN